VPFHGARVMPMFQQLTKLLAEPIQCHRVLQVESAVDDAGYGCNSRQAYPLDDFTANTDET